MAEIRVGKAGECGARGPYEHPGHASPLAQVGAFEHHRGGAAGKSVLDVATAVLLEAGNGHEDLARRDLARIVSDATNLRGQLTKHPLVSQSVEQPHRGHGLSAH